MKLDCGEKSVQLTGNFKRLESVHYQTHIFNDDFKTVLTYNMKT